MNILADFIIFIFLMGISLVAGISMVFPLLAGFILFSATALRNGTTGKEIVSFVRDSLGDSFIVVGIMLIIGCLTGIWRQSGTIAYFVTAGVTAIPPRMFLLAAFLLSSVMSFALGTSFGVSATAGVILASIARAGGVNMVLAAGAILSGVYVGDRGSPAASSANLVAVLTHTDMRQNVREMLRCSLVPFFLSALFYGILSFVSPMDTVDTGTLSLLSEEFHLTPLCLIPAVLMILLPFFHVKIRLSMVISLLAAFFVSVFCQQCTVKECMEAMIFGYKAKNTALSAMLSGGGVVSMLEVSAILTISCSYGKIFQGTGMLEPVDRFIHHLSEKTGRFPLMVLSGLFLSAVFCNQTIGAIMQSNLTESLYREEERTEKMLDMENSVILLSAMVPWCIACSVPMTMIGSDIRSIPFTVYLWLVPLWWYLKNRQKKK